jgi:hypothetical protein
MANHSGSPLTYISRASRLVYNYALAPLLGRPSTAAFWYSPEAARVTDAATAAAYRAANQPAYVMDYTGRLQYRYTGPEGIIVLPYGGRVGDRINPEAAFQYALGLHDAWLATDDNEFRRRFLYYADFFLARQTQDGDWLYEFDWYESRAPWSSALAQARGASVMLRAERLTHADAFGSAAKRALSRFNTPLEQGGYLACFAPAKCRYFEEYPKQRNVTINGFMASLFGLFEVGHFLDDAAARMLWEDGAAALELMLPYFETSRWTTYDFDAAHVKGNPHSPYYHRMCVNYLNVLSQLSGRPGILGAYHRWRGRDRPVNRALALAAKARHKLAYR